MPKTPKEWAEELVEAWTHGTDAKENLSDWMWRDLRKKAEASFLLAQDQAYKRGLASRS